jgi:hypothetical protein
MNRMSLAIVTSGQSGAESAAADFALAHGVPVRGYCDRGGRAKLGADHPKNFLEERPDADCTASNVYFSDATLVVSIAKVLKGHARRSAVLAKKQRKPFLHLCRKNGPPVPGRALVDFMLEHRPHRLVVIGPTAAEEPEVSTFTRAVLEEAWEIARQTPMPTMLPEALRERLRFGKYSGWAIPLSEDELDGLLWAIGEYGYRAYHILPALELHEPKDIPFIRAALGLKVIAEFCEKRRINREEVSARVRRAVSEHRFWEQGFLYDRMMESLQSYELDYQV